MIVADCSENVVIDYNDDEDERKQHQIHVCERFTIYYYYFLNMYL